MNSLSGDLLITGIECVAPFGHFCEIGKFDLQENSSIGLRALESNVSFHAIDLSLMFDKPKIWNPIRELLEEGMRSGEVVPIAYHVFDDVETALRTISTGKHTGKILVQVPSQPTDVRRHFRTHGTHVVVGGLGGFGLELVQYLYSRGAERVIVISRKGPDSYQHNNLGAAEVSNVNLFDAVACQEFIQSLGKTLIGVWQLAMVLNDRLYCNMTEECWKATVDPKLTITANLDAATRQFSLSLEHFVCWSSVTSLFGNAGQTNYAYGNGAMEAICIQRREVALPGLAIQWGLIGGVGVMAEREGITTGAFKFDPQHIDSCLDCLDDLLFAEHAVVASYLPAETLSLKNSSLACLTLSQRVARILGVSIAKVKDSDSLASLGMDSLQSVEVANILSASGHEGVIPDLKSAKWAAICALD